MKFTKGGAIMAISSEDKRRMRREKAANDALQAMTDIIDEASDGSTEETQAITAMVALKATERALLPLRQALMKYDLEKRK